MPARYSLRLQFSPRLDSALVTRELLQLCQDALVDEVILFIAAEEWNNGHETLNELRHWLATLRPWKQALEQRGVQVSLNPWITVLHCDRGRQLKPGQNWQTMVDWKGNSASAIACPLDHGWRAYYREAMALYAAEHYRVIWIEDDVRLANHAPLDWGGCFCPLHVAEFNRRAGAHATRPEIVDALLRPGEPHPWRSLWLGMWDETQTAMVAEWRQIANRTGSQLGLMSSGLEAHAMEGRRWEHWWQALAGDGRPVHRPHFAGYTDTLGSNLPVSIAMLDSNRTLQRPGTEIGPEIETFPYGWAKSLRQTAAMMVLAQVFGSDRLLISLYDVMHNLPSEDPAKADFLRKWKPTLSWLSDLFPPTLYSQGIGCPWRQDMSHRIHTSAGEEWTELRCQTGDWASWLGGFGHAFQMREGDTVNVLAGDAAWALNDDEIRRLLPRGLLLDGPAAAILNERGFGHQIGLAQTHFITQSEVLFAVEEVSNARFGLRAGSQVSLNDKPCARRLVQGTPLPGAEVVSILLAPTGNPVGHGVVVYENNLGGRVAICPWDANGAAEGHGGQRNVQRQVQIQKLVDWLAWGSKLGRATGAPGLVSQFLSDGSLWRGVVWNSSPDAATELRVELPVRMAVAEAVQIDACGERIPARWQDGVLCLLKPLHQWECVVLRDESC